MSELTPFPCTGCGQCCKQVGPAVEKAKWLVLKGKSTKEQKEIAKFPYKWDENGACENLNEDNSCKVYDDRPDICSIRKTWENHSSATWRQYMILSAAACNAMQEEAKIPESFRVVLPAKDEGTGAKVISM